METEKSLTLRAKKLGVMIRDARLAHNMSKKETGEAIGASSSKINSYETGKKSPSLPELEILAHLFDVPIEHFFGTKMLSISTSSTENMHIEHHLSLRNRAVGAILKETRENSDFTLKEVHELTGISPSRIRRYENGETPIPIPELELLRNYLNLHLKDLNDPSDLIGKWIAEQRTVLDFHKLPLDLQEFIAKPVNKPYLEIAMKLEKLQTDELRAVAENLLEITI